MFVRKSFYHYIVFNTDGSENVTMVGDFEINADIIRLPPSTHFSTCGLVQVYYLCESIFSFSILW